MRSISAVIPVYNSEASLEELYARLTAALRGAARDFEIILVDDGSSDCSWDAIAGLALKDKRVRGFRLYRNFGQHNAILCGIRAAAKEAVVTLDDDLQNPPEEIPELVRKLEEGFDVVYGSPASRHHGAMRNASQWIAKVILQRTLGAEIAGSVSPFRAFDAELAKAFAGYGGAFVSVDVLLSWCASRYAVVSVRHDPRKKGASNYTVKKLFNHMFNMMTGFSILPLQLASMVGFIFTLFGMFVLGYVLVRYMINGVVVPGFAFLASIIAIFSGAQMFALGIIGEYLARMYFRSMGRPPFMVREKTS